MKIYLIINLLLFFQYSTAQNSINFRDVHLKIKLLEANIDNKIAKNENDEKVKIDIDNNGEISQDEALKIYSLNFYPGEISNLEGIENFQNLKKLDLSTNNLEKFENIDLPNLEELNLLDNDIVSLNINNLQNLKHLICQQNKLKTLSIIDLNKLEWIFAGFGDLEYVNLKKLPKLNHLDITNNKLTGSQNFSNLKSLETLYISNNGITSINIDNLENLRDLRIENNKISKINKKIIENLNIFECVNNKFKCKQK